MLTECAVFCSATPICSAMFMKRLLNTSSRIGSASVPMACARARVRGAASATWSRAVMRAVQPGSITMVWFASMISAGPVTVLPGVSPSRRKMPASCHWPPEKSGRVVSVDGRFPVSGCSGSGGAGVLAALDLDRLDHDGLVGRDEAELRLVRGLEIGLRGGGVAVEGDGSAVSVPE
jgi:hypothetical protein